LTIGSIIVRTIILDHFFAELEPPNKLAINNITKIPPAPIKIPSKRAAFFYYSISYSIAYRKFPAPGNPNLAAFWRIRSMT
jgi:hypothetical protein